ncbi:MAG: hypothetical protein L0322_01455, partial [Chloroflexi bacterium]|nr:hypothetical protein [Chloroflexota bacterium]
MRTPSHSFRHSMSIDFSLLDTHQPGHPAVNDDVAYLRQQIRQCITFVALIDPGPNIIGLPMFDLAYAAQPWLYGQEYLQALVTAYQRAAGPYDAPLFYTSLLCVAYHFSRYFNHNMAHIRP